MSAARLASLILVGAVLLAADPPRTAPGPLHVQVASSADGKPVAGVVVRLAGRYGVTRPDGEAVFDGVPAGELRLRISHVGFDRLEQAVALPPGRREPIAVTLVPSPQVLVRGQVTLEGDGRPIAGAAVTLTPVRLAAAVQGPFQFSCGWDGAFTIPEAPVGLYRVAIGAPGCVPSERELEVRPGMDAVAWSIARETRSADLTVSVIDAQSASPVAGARVVLAEAWPRGVVAEATSDGAGRAAFRGLSIGGLNWESSPPAGAAGGAVAAARGPLTLRVDAEGRQPALVPVPQGAGADVEVRLDADAEIDEAEPNDELGAAQSLHFGAAATWAFGRPGDHDCFGLTLPYPATLSIEVARPKGLWTRVGLHRADGSVAGEWGATGDGVDRFTTAPLRAGRYVVLLREWNDAAASTENGRVRVTSTWVPDPQEPNDDAFQARRIRAGDEARGWIFPVGDVDLFRFEVPRPSHVRFTTPTHALWRRLHILDSSGKLVAEGGAAGAAGEVAAQLPPGEFFLRVVEWNGAAASAEPYTVRMETIEDDGVDDDGTPAQARPLDLGSQAATTIFPGRDRDAWSVSIPSAGRLHAWVVPAGGMWVRLHALDAQCSLLAETGAAGAAAGLSWDAPGPATVTLRTMEWNDTGCSTNPCVVRTWFEPCDEMEALSRNDTPETATPLELGEQVQASVHPNGDDDWYGIVVDFPGVLKVTGRQRAAHWTRLELHESGGRRVADWGLTEPEAPFRWEVPVLAGEYHLRVCEWNDSVGHPCPYTLRADLDRAEPAEREPLRGDPPRALALGEAQVFFLDQAGDQDRFVFDLAEARSFHIRMRKPPGPWLRLALHDDRSGERLADFGVTGDAEWGTTWEAKGPTRYRLEARDWNDNAASPSPGYLLVDAVERAIPVERISSAVDPFDPTLVSFSRAEEPGARPGVRVEVDADGDGKADVEVPVGAPTTFRYPAEGLYRATAWVRAEDGVATRRDLWVEAVGARERKGIAITVRFPNEGQTIESDSPARASAISYSGARVSRLSLSVDGREVGTCYSAPYEIDVPWRSLGGGGHTLEFAAADSSGESARVVRTVHLSEYFDLQPRDGAVLSGDSIRVSWRGTSFGAATVRYRPRGTTEWKEETGESGSLRAVTLTGLEAGTAYEILPVGGGEPGPLRTVTRVKGLAFGRPRYGATIQRDYDQRVPISVRNHGEGPLTVRLECGSPDDPLLLVGFVGQGSEGAPFDLAPGEERDFLLGISAQDVIRPTAAFPIRLTSDRGFSDEAEVALDIKLPVVNLEWEAMGEPPFGLVRTFRLHNRGDGLTDLEIVTEGGVRVSPQVSHAVFPAGGAMEIKVTPVLHEGFRSVTGKLTARAVGKESVTNVELALPEGQSLFAVFLLPGDESGTGDDPAQSLLLKARALAGSFLDPDRVDWTRRDLCEDRNGDGKLDRWSVEDEEEEILWAGDDTNGDGEIDFVHADVGVDGQFDYSAFRTKDGWEPTNLLEAWLEMRFSLPWARVAYEKHDADILFNGVVIGSLRDSIPEGNYTFQIPPTALKMGLGEGNVVEVRSKHLRGGHYIVNSDFRITTRLTSSRGLVAAVSEEEARKNADAIQGVTTRGADYAVSSADMRIETPSELAKGADVSIVALVRNIGATRTSDVEVALICSSPGGPGTEISRNRLDAVPLVGAARVTIPWKAAAGVHQLKIVVDPDGRSGETNRQNNEAMITVTVPGDDEKPVLQVLEPSADSATDSIVVVKVNATDDSGISRVEARVDGGVPRPLASTGDGGYEGRCLVQPGEHTITATCADSSGNQIEQAVKLVVRAERPGLADLLPADGTVVPEREVRVQFRCGEGTALAGVRVSGGPWHRMTIRDGLTEAEVGLPFGKVVLDVMVADMRGVVQVVSRSIECLKQREAGEAEGAAPSAPERGEIDIDGVGVVDLFSGFSRVLGSEDAKARR